MIKFIQKNLKGGSTATNLFLQTIRELDIGVALVQEPYNGINDPWQCSGYRTYRGSGVEALILVRNDLECRVVHRQEGFIGIKMMVDNRDIFIFNVYLNPSGDIARSLDQLTVCLAGKDSVIIGGDFNARGQAWGDRLTSRRGRIMEKFLGGNGFTLLNNNVTPTFLGPMGVSFIDLTFFRGLEVDMFEWELLDILDGSDHKSIVFSLKSSERPTGRKLFKTMTKASLERIKQWASSWNIKEYTTEEGISCYIDSMTDAIHGLMEWRDKLFINHKSVAWWSPELRALRNKVRSLRRVYQRSDISVKQRNYARYREARKKLDKDIFASKISSWRSYVQKYPDTWDHPVKFVFHGRKKDEAVRQDPRPNVEILREHFPFRARVSFNDFDFSKKGDFTPITLTEIIGALKSFRKKKAPGIDEIRLDVWKTIFEERPEILLTLFNNILNLAEFPNSWKKAKVILVPKPGKTEGTPGSMRPISLLPTLSKVFERILLDRMEFFVADRMNPRQFGFRRGVSSVDALESLFGFVKNGLEVGHKFYALASLDIKGAFNDFRPDFCIKQLVELGCPGNYCNLMATYLRNRRMSLEECTIVGNNGTPQGSCVGPFLWNLNVNKLLEEIPVAEDILAQAYADDIIIGVLGSSRRDVERKMRPLLTICEEWSRACDVKFSGEKCVSLSNIHRSRKPSLKLGCVPLRNVRETRYLGIDLNEDMTWSSHVYNMRAKAAALTAKLKRVCGKDWGINRDSIKDIYNMVIVPVMTYGCSAWFQNSAECCKKLLTLQRVPLLRITNCFRTVSNEALPVLAGVVPLDLRVKEIVEGRRLRKAGAFVGKRWPKVHPATNPCRREDIRPTYEGTEIFTDGSKSDAGVGAAVIVMENGQVINTFKSKLSEHCDNFQAEQWALLVAVKYLIQSGVQARIFTDSDSSIKQICGFRAKSDIACAIIEMAVEAKQEVILTYIKAHADNHGNELADKAAKEASQDGTPTHLASTRRLTMLKLRKTTMRTWQDRWDTAEKGRPLYRHISNVDTDRFLREYHTNQVLTGHGLFPGYFARFKVRENSRCLCGRIPKWVTHYLKRCPSTLHISRELVYASNDQERWKVFGKIGQWLEKQFSDANGPTPEEGLVIEEGLDDSDDPDFDFEEVEVEMAVLRRSPRRS
jgi:ribonuclease HI